MKRLSTVLAPLLVLSGCGNAALESGWGGSTEALADGRVRVTNPAQGLWDHGQPWRLVPLVQLGEMDGAEAEVFGVISGLQVDDAGRLYVLDRQANELRIFDAAGTHLRTVGRAGAGPGEYANANGLEWLGPDSLLVIDQAGSRYSVLTTDGDYVRSVPRALGFYGWIASSAVHGGRVYEISSVRGGGESHPALLGTPVRAGSSPALAVPNEDETAAALAAGDTVLLPKPPVTPVEAFSIRTERGGMGLSVPFAAAPVYHLGADGTVWHGHGGSPRLFQSSLAGDTLLEIHFDITPAPVTASEVEDWLEGAGPERFRAMGGKLDVARIPSSRPIFDDVHVDPDGYVWLSLPVSGPETAFGVFDPDGRFLGRLQVQGVRRDRFVPIVVREGRLYFVGRDELDVQRVYGFEIDRS